MRGSKLISVLGLALLATPAFFLAADPVFAYIGPGAGLEFVGYFIALIATVGVALFSILMYPIYAVIRFLRGNKEPAAATAPSEPVTADSSVAAPE